MTILQFRRRVPVDVLERPAIGHHRAQLERVTGLTWRERLDRYANAAAVRQRRRQAALVALAACHQSITRGRDLDLSLDRLWEAVGS